MSIRPAKNFTEVILNDLGGVVHVAQIMKIRREAVVQWVKHDRVPPLSAMKLYAWTSTRKKSAGITIPELFHYLEEPFYRKELKKSQRFKRFKKAMEKVNG